MDNPDDATTQVDALDSVSLPASTPHLSKHRAPPIQLPSDAAISAALVLRLVQTGETAFDRSAAIEAMTGRVRLLADPNTDSATLLSELSAHAAVLDALFQRWTCEAVSARQPEHRVDFAKLALNSQAAYTRTLIALEGLRQQRKGQARLSLNEVDLSEDVTA